MASFFQSAVSAPPHKLQKSRPITAEEALSHLQSYLSAVPENAYLLPNAKLDINGPTAQSVGSSVVLHNLDRVEAGLRGEYLKPEIEIDGEGANGDVAMGGTAEKEAEGATEEWQDLDQYQLEQESDEEDVYEKRAVDKGAEEDDGEGEKESVPVKVKAASDAVPKKKVDKEARKKEKKERQKDMRRQKSAAKAAS